MTSRAEAALALIAAVLLTAGITVAGIARIGWEPPAQSLHQLQSEYR